MCDYHQTNLELREEIIKQHNLVAGIFKASEHLRSNYREEPAAFDINVGNEFRYVLRCYLDADTIRRSEEGTHNGKEENVQLMQARHHLRIAHDDMIDWMEKYFREFFHNLMEKYGAGAIAFHIDIQECHDIQIQIEDIIVKSRENRDLRRDLYDNITKAPDGLAHKMINQINKLEKAEPFIQRDAKKAMLKNPWIVGIVTAIIALVLREIVPWLFGDVL